MMIHYLRALAARLQGLFGDRGAERELDDEIETHLRLLTERYVRQGMTEAEAAWTARRQFGNITLLQEVNREMRGIRFIDILFQDLRYASRALRKNPGFTLTALLTLALGIGVNTAIFTLFYSLAWRPLPVKDPASVVNIWQTIIGDDYGRRLEGTPSQISYPEYINYRDQTRSFAGLAAYAEETLTLTGGEAERINAQMVTDNYFAVLGGEAALGRTFVPNECQTHGACSQVVLSHTFWQRRFSSDPNVIGKTLILNRRPFTVVGVTARSWSSMGIVAGPLFDLPLIAPDVWVPLMMRGQLVPERDLLTQRDCSCHWVVGRLKPGISLKQAQADMAVAASRWDQNELVTNQQVR